MLSGVPTATVHCNTLSALKLSGISNVVMKSLTPCCQDVRGGSSDDWTRQFPNAHGVTKDASGIPRRVSRLTHVYVWFHALYGTGTEVSNNVKDLAPTFSRHNHRITNDLASKLILHRAF